MSHMWPITHETTTHFFTSLMRKGNALSHIYLQGSAFEATSVLKSGNYGITIAYGITDHGTGSFYTYILAAAHCEWD